MNANPFGPFIVCFCFLIANAHKDRIVSPQPQWQSRRFAFFELAELRGYPKSRPKRRF
jgi:hypothetical protein